MDIQQKRLIKGGQGNQASEYNSAHWFVRAGSWQYGAEAGPEAIEGEKREEDMKYGVPHADVLDNCAVRNPPDGPLPNPHNFSSNPGFMAGTGTLGATAVASQGNAVLPAPGNINPAADGSPQIVSSGYSG